MQGAVAVPQQALAVSGSRLSPCRASLRDLLGPSHGRRWPSQSLGSHREEPAPGICLGSGGLAPAQPLGGQRPPPAWELRVAWRTRAGQPAPTRLCSSCRLLLADGPSKPSEPRLEPEKQGGSQSLPAQACALPHPAGSF